MVDTQVTVAVYADTEIQTPGTACVDLVQVMVPAHAASEADWKPISCVFDLRTWNRIQFKERNGAWFVHAVYVLFPLVGERPELGRPATCADWSHRLIEAQDDPAAAQAIGNCYITPPTRGTDWPTRPVWARLPEHIAVDPDPDAPCWHLASVYGASGEGFTRDVLCESHD